MIIDDILKLGNELNLAKKRLDDIRTREFIEILISLDVHSDIIDEIRSKELPSHIITSSNIFPLCQQTLSQYSEIIESKYIDTKHTMVLAWN